MIHCVSFTPIYKERIWGGRNFERLFGRAIPSGKLIGESWELADLPTDKSIIAEGPLQGKDISWLIQNWGKNLLGCASLDSGQFPLLVKFLDAQDALSVQVHPDYESAKKLGGNVRAKYECWYVLDAKPDSFVYLGFKPGATRDIIRDSISKGSLEDWLIKVPAEKGDFFYLPGGMVHAIGAGLVLAEVQTPSDTTYRLYDWNRIDQSTGKPRELHIDLGLDAIRYDLDSSRYIKRSSDINLTSGSVELAKGPTFSVSKVIAEKGESTIETQDHPTVWIVLEGSGIIRDSAGTISLSAGKTILIPPGIKNASATFDVKSLYLDVKL
jgi:mannose-6-phosphate isomerase